MEPSEQSSDNIVVSADEILVLIQAKFPEIVAKCTIELIEGKKKIRKIITDSPGSNN